MFEVMANTGIQVKMVSTSEIKVSTVVNEKEMVKAVEALHEAFKLGQRCKSACLIAWSLMKNRLPTKKVSLFLGSLDWVSRIPLNGKCHFFARRLISSVDSLKNFFCSVNCSARKPASSWK